MLGMRPVRKILDSRMQKLWPKYYIYIQIDNKKTLLIQPGLMNDQNNISL